MDVELAREHQSFFRPGEGEGDACKNVEARGGEDITWLLLNIMEISPGWSCVEARLDSASLVRTRMIRESYQSLPVMTIRMCVRICLGYKVTFYE